MVVGLIDVKLKVNSYNMLSQDLLKLKQILTPHKPTASQSQSPNNAAVADIKIKQHKPSTSKHKRCSQECMKQAELMMQ